MRNPSLTVLTFLLLIVIGGTSLAYADCESDMIQLEKALAVPKLTAEAKAALDDAKAKSVAAMKKDDDGACHKVIAEALPKAGMSLR